jgi:hypothetical protein
MPAVRKIPPIDGFGSWSINQRDARKRQAWRFGKVVTLKNYEVIFKMEDDALPFCFPWSGIRSLPPA